MKDFPIDKYKIYYNDSKVIAVSSFAGRPVRAVAKCSLNDKFDLDYGIQLATTRCNMKVAEKRMERAIDKYWAAVQAETEATKMLEAAKNYFMDAQDELDAAKEKLLEIEKN